MSESIREKGLLIVVSGPSGVGKGSIAKQLLANDPNMTFSVSATTRGKRPGETDGVDYFFKTVDEFRAMIAEDAFLEYTQVFNSNYYGTPRAYVEQRLESGMDVLLDIDVVGATNVLKAFPDAVSIFILPPSMAVLRERLTGRGTEPPDVVERRLNTAYIELKCVDKYEYAVVNDDLEDAIIAVETIIAAERLKVTRSRAIRQIILEGNESL